MVVMFAILYGYLAENALGPFEWPMLAVKVVRQMYQASADLLSLLDEFKRMVNVCVAVGMQENVSSLKTLYLRSYRHLSRDMLRYYRLGAISTATRILRNHRRVRRKNPRTRLSQSRWRQVKSTSQAQENQSDKDLTEPPIQDHQHHVALSPLRRS